MRHSFGGVVATGLLVWACAKANDSDLITQGVPVAGASGRGGASAGGRGGTSANAGTSSGSGGSAGKAGSSNAAGTSAGGTGSGGKGAGGSSSAGTSSGGTSAQSGRSGNGGSSGTDQEGGSPGTSGSGGSGGIPPEVLERADLVLHYAVGDEGASETSRAIFFHIYFENRSDDALDLANVVVRYWFTAEASNFTTNSYFHGSLIAGLQAAFVSDGDDSHLKITFSGQSIPAHNTTYGPTEVQYKLELPQGSSFDQSDDHSFNAGLTSTSQPAPHDRITAYIGEKLVWGCEPSGTCANMGEGGAGGEGGGAGQAGQVGEAGSGTSGSNAGGEGGQGGQPADGGEPSIGGQAGAG